MNSRQIFSRFFFLAGHATIRGVPNDCRQVRHGVRLCARTQAHSGDMSSNAELASAATAAAKIIEEAPFAAASMPALVKYLDLQVRHSIPRTLRPENRAEIASVLLRSAHALLLSVCPAMRHPHLVSRIDSWLKRDIHPYHRHRTQTSKLTRAQIQHGAVDSDANRCLVKLCQLHPAQCADAAVLARALTQALTNMPLTDFVDQYSLLSEEMVCDSEDKREDGVVLIVDRRRAFLACDDTKNRMLLCCWHRLTRHVCASH